MRLGDCARSGRAHRQTAPRRRCPPAGRMGLVVRRQALPVARPAPPPAPAWRLRLRRPAAAAAAISARAGHRPPARWPGGWRPGRGSKVAVVARAPVLGHGPVRPRAESGCTGRPARPPSPVPASRPRAAPDRRPSEGRFNLPVTRLVRASLPSHESLCSESESAQ
jgi:hypothetical protein